MTAADIEPVAAISVFALQSGGQIAAGKITHASGKADGEFLGRQQGAEQQ
jgi:hypothetical protein